MTSRIKFFALIYWNTVNDKQNEVLCFNPMKFNEWQTWWSSLLSFIEIQWMTNRMKFFAFIYWNSLNDKTGWNYLFSLIKIKKMNYDWITWQIGWSFFYLLSFTKIQRMNYDWIISNKQDEVICFNLMRSREWIVIDRRIMSPVFNASRWLKSMYLTRTSAG